MSAAAERCYLRMLASAAEEAERSAHHREVTGQRAITLRAAEAALAEGHILHVRAARLPGQRRTRRGVMPAVDLTVGPDARGGYLVVDYSRTRSGVEERYELAADAVRAVRRALSWDRLDALRAALARVYPPEVAGGESLRDEAARLCSAGAILARAAWKYWIGGPRDQTGKVF